MKLLNSLPGLALVVMESKTFEYGGVTGHGFLALKRYWQFIRWLRSVRMGMEYC